MNIEKILASIPSASREKRNQMRRNALEKLDGADVAWHKPAQRLLTTLAAQESTEHAELVAEVAGLEPAERVIRAFTAEPMTATEEKLICVLLDHPDSTSAELTEKMGWKAQSWHLHFGTMCANRGVYLGPPPYAGQATGQFYTGILAQFGENTSRFTMKPDVAAAFAQLGLKPRAARG